jgi:hypothetical protein
MQNLVKATLVMLLIAVVGLIFTSCENATVEPELDAPELAIEEGGELSEEEFSGLRFMREEE